MNPLRLHKVGCSAGLRTSVSSLSSGDECSMSSREAVHGNFYFSNVPVFLKGISLVCNKARVAKISTAYHGRRERTKNSETGGL